MKALRSQGGQLLTWTRLRRHLERRHVYPIKTEERGFNNLEIRMLIDTVRMVQAPSVMIPTDVRTTIERMIKHVVGDNETSPVFHEVHAVAAWLKEQS